MRKTNKNLTKQILTLMLAFVMVFTGMGIGSWGVDTAWANDSGIGFFISVDIGGNEEQMPKIERLDAEKIEASHKGNENYIVEVPLGTQQIYLRFSDEGDFSDESAYVADYNNTAAKRCVSETYVNKIKATYKTPPGSIIANQYKTQNYLDGKYQVDLKNYIVNQQSYPGYTFPTQGECYHLIIYKIANNPTAPSVTKAVSVLIQAGKKESTTITDEQKKPLTDLLETVTGVNEQNWYRENDRYNGKTYNKKGFWNEFTAQNGPREIAQLKLDAATTDAMISSAVTELQSAIANLIPKSQLNATNLYEVIQECKENCPDDYLEFFTKATAKNLKAALADAEKYLALLFNEEATEKNPNGANQTENVYGNQGKADGYAKALNTARRGLVHLDDFAKAQDDASLIQALAKRFSMTENNGKYTEESWSAFTSAREEALTYAAAHPLTKDSTYSEVVGYARHRKAFSQAAYGLTSKTEDDRISVSLVFTDDYLLRKPSAKWNYSEVSPGSKTYTLTKAKGYTIAALFKEAGINRTSSIYNGPFEAQWAIMINDETPADLEEVIRLKDGDVVHFIHRQQALYEPVYGLEPAPGSLTVDYLGALRFAETGTQVAKAGEALTLHVERTSAALVRYTGTYEAFEGAELAAYGPQNEDGSYPEKPIWTGSLTDVSGKASLKLYETGTYLLTAFDPRENDNEEHIYPSLNAAAPYITVCVEEAEDSSAVKAELKKELDKIYNDCKSLDPEYKTENPGYYSDENIAAIEKAYHNALTVLNDKESTAAESYKAQQEAIKAIQLIQKTTTEAYDKSLAAFRENLNKLPDDVTLITKSVESIVEALINAHESMTPYAQKKLLTEVEQKKYDQIAALQGKLPEAKKYKLNLVVKADEAAQSTIESVLAYLRSNPATQDRGVLGAGNVASLPVLKPFSFLSYDAKKEAGTEFENNEADPLTQIRLISDLSYSAYFQTRDGKGTFKVPNTNAVITDENLGLEAVIAPVDKASFNDHYEVSGGLTLTIDGKAYELKSISYEGLNKSDVAEGKQRVYDASAGYKGKSNQYVNVDFLTATKDFTMPYNDVTITLNWGPVTSAAELQTAKEAATSILNEAFAEYEKNKTSYGNNWSKLEKAYTDGIAAIGAAATIDEVAQARKDAITKMSKVTKQGQTEPSKDAVGTVHVIVENTTFTKDKWGGKTYWDGILVNTDVEITAKSTMMSCVVDALNRFGYEQKGAENNYISEINGLAEFDGGSQSGWMGTLNDWFNNEGFGNFTVANGALGDGDEIRIMYTTKGYGEDLGGSWANSNTTLKDLSVSGGTLTPSFTSGTSGGSYDYTLLISGKTANIKVTPTAANKNFLTKIFLNEKVTSNVQGSSFYKRTQYIPVTAGDTIYVGCGERRWPSMNNQAGNTQANGGTWYALKVVNSSNAKDTIEKAIAELPAADKIKIGNYKNTKDAAKDIRDLYNSLTSTVQGTIDKDKLDKLKAVEDKVKFYSEIDDAKAKLNALTDSSSSSQAKAALSAYEKLTKEQKEYITEADAAKFNELAKKYNLSTITGAAEMPESEVETTGTTGSAVTTSPTTVKMSGTTATVTVKADNQKEILKQAKEKKSAQVVLAIANSDAKGAEKLELNLDKSFLESLLKDTSAKLVVKTPLGQKTYERDELQKLVNETTGTTVKAEINKDNVDTAAEEPTEDNAANIAKAKSIVKNMKLVARSSKTAKKNIKAVLKNDTKVKASIKELKDLGFTVKYRFYRSTKKAGSYKSTVTKKTASYTNTSGKKGTKYFYKVQVRVYDENGKLVAKTALKQCKYASRTWTKAK